jgi:hypothetical protein
MEGKFGSTVVKATLGGQTRKWRLNGGVKHADLVNSVRKEFGIGSAGLRLKYKDSGIYILLNSYLSFRRRSDRVGKRRRLDIGN